MTILTTPAVISGAVLADRLSRLRGWMAATAVDAVIAYGAPAALGSRTVTAGYVRWRAGWTTTSLPVMVVVPLVGTPTVVTMGPHDTRAFILRAGSFGDVVAAGSV